jgi:hypothetical protein
VLPNDDLPFRLKADSSGIPTGAVLSQQSCDDNAWHSVAFLLKALNSVERNYEIHDTKMLAIIRGLKEWRHYLEGARHPVEIWTDHKDTQEESVAKAARELRKDKGRGMVKSTEWSESEGLLMFRGKIYIPKDRELRR